MDARPLTQRERAVLQALLATDVSDLDDLNAAVRASLNGLSLYAIEDPDSGRSDVCKLPSDWPAEIDPRSCNAQRAEGKY